MDIKIQAEPCFENFHHDFYHYKFDRRIISRALFIATYSQAGAQFGFNTLWTLVLTYPFMVGIQLVSARIGRVTGRGLAANIRRAYSPWRLYAIVLLLRWPT